MHIDVHKDYNYQYTCSERLLYVRLIDCSIKQTWRIYLKKRKDYIYGHALIKYC